MMAAVALATALVVAVSTAMHSVQRGLERRLVEALGAADARIIHLFQGRFSASLLEDIERWPEVERAVGRFVSALTLIRKNPTIDPETGLPVRITAQTSGIDPEFESLVRPRPIDRGRSPEQPGDIVLDSDAAKTLDADLGDTLIVQRFGEPIELTLTGIFDRPRLGTLQRHQAIVLRSDLENATERHDSLTDIAIILRGDRDVDEFCARYVATLPDQLQLEPAELARTGFDRRIRAAHIVFTITSLWAFLSCSYIIIVGMTTGITERLRELAIVRCVGASRAQAFIAQLWTGVIIGAIGAIAGIPLGIGLAAGLIWWFADVLPGGLAISPLWIGLAIAGSIGAGLIGAVWPAFEAARISPLRAASAAARTGSRRRVRWFAIVGIAALVLQTSVYLAIDPSSRFWFQAVGGVVLMQTAYFLLAVPVLWLLVVSCARPLARLLALPPDLLRESVLSIPYRLGLTAGILMLGVAILISGWTSTAAVRSDWLGRMTFADGFVFKRSGLSESERDAVAALPFISGTAPIAYLPLRVKDDQLFGVEGLAPPNVTCIGFEPLNFFEINRVQWVAGDPETAIPRLKEGDAVLVAKEFLTTRAVELGDTLTLGAGRIWHDYEIVGVVEAAGLDVATQFFGIRNAYNEHAIRCVFADFETIASRFDRPDVLLVQVNLSDDISDEDAREAIAEATPGVLFVSGRRIKSRVDEIGSALIIAETTIAFAALLLACIAVSNVLIANVVSRQFEYGMLRAVGATRGHLVRLVLGEAALLAATAMIIGYAYGYHYALIDVDLYRTLAGMELSPRPPVIVAIVGWMVVLVMTLVAALPAAARFTKKTPRELFAIGRGA